MMLHQRVSALSPFFLPRSRVALNLALRLAFHKHGEIRSDVRCAKDRGDGGAAIIEGKNDKTIYRNESGDRGGDELGLVDRGRHGPGVANAAAVRNSLSVFR